jgi:putative spermidine/putrescine transport system substrate-binding protein
MTVLTRRMLLKTTAGAAAALAAPGIVRAQINQLVIGCAASHTNWMEAIVVPHMRRAIGAEVIFEGTRSAVNLEKMVANRASQYLSVVQMDDPVMLQAVAEELLERLTPETVPSGRTMCSLGRGSPTTPICSAVSRVGQRFGRPKQKGGS